MATPQRGDVELVFVPVATAKAVAKGDMVGRAADGTVVKASETTWDTDLATTQAAFKALFLGAASQAKTANADIVVNTGPNSGKIRCANGGVFPYTAAAGTYLIGTLVGPAKASGNALEDQKVAVVATEAVAIGRVAGREGVNPATVEVMLLSTLLPDARQS